MRVSGVLMPVFSLAGKYGVGGFGQEAFDFIDFLSSAGQKVWQLLPMNPTGLGDSPYSSCSAFAGNPYFIDPEGLVKDGLLKKADLKGLKKENKGRVDYGFLSDTRYPMLRKAYKAFLKQQPVPGYDTPYSDDYYRFLLLNDSWLEDYALFRAGLAANEQKSWTEWPEALRLRKPEALEALRKEQAEEIGFWKFVEYEFWHQWKAVRAYAAKKGVQLLGDMPFYVAADSADAWAGGKLYEMDEAGKTKRVAGCPPDYFSAEGQLWGNPLYNWPYHRQTGYDWWIRRLRRNLQLYDKVRIDHFRAFDTYWAIPGDSETAKTGKWEQGPGMEFFDTVREKLGGRLPLVAEDLGDLFDSVRNLLKKSGLPGMKVLEFAFSYPQNEYMPHNHIQNSVVYTGTHDNNTLLGWLQQDMNDQEKDYARKYFNVKTDEELFHAVRRCALGSVADTCILPMQDWLGLDGDARMNVPGMVGGNWGWRIPDGSLTPQLADEMSRLCATYARC